MKILYTFLLVSLTSGAIAYGQEVNLANNNFDPVKGELTDWDPIRGPWLASSMQAMAENRPIPARTFPENFTPHQMLRMVPADSRNSIRKIAKENNSVNPAFWSSIDNYVSVAGCQTNSGRTYGDPHVVSYDGARYSFQTVGEFVLSKSNDGDMEVQTRQRPLSDEFSLNTAVAMNVGGDRVCIYAKDYPDADYSTPVRLDGKSIHINGGTYFLPHGGTIRKSGDSYHVNWPAGESVVAKLRNTRNFDFMDVTVNVPNCSRSGYAGVMGNANGNERDDFNAGTVSPPFETRGDSDYWKRERQAYIAKQFAEVHRIDQSNSLFDYLPGYTTASYTDRNYPRVFPKAEDFDSRRFQKSRRYCEQRINDPRDMNGCIYDHAELGIEPTNRPVLQDPTQGTVLRPVTGRIENVNPKPKPIGAHQVNTQKEPTNKPTPQATSSNPSTSKKPNDDRNTSTSPSKPTTSRPVFSSPSTPRPATPKPSTPRPVITRPSTPRPSTPKSTPKAPKVQTKIGTVPGRR